ncbi:hypothetical protein SAMN05216474_0046 [Lishizhenia tianjinensis]|uniref:Uncharacterized protein n=1 Tax=Lishizhenia tianjinensis TaxID=477690 RepID=A0A1I6X9W7_9FLAO|nr:hypothetical protein [Lishizhenia tianjinensis]SFT35168.1 hypothetical protein SAMN05216474_0046 [Lishizhenia tianjinensis]
MYPKHLLLFMLLLTLFACQQNPTPKTFTGDLAQDIENDTIYPSSSRLPVADILERLKYQKRSIDTLIANNELLIESWLLDEPSEHIIRLLSQDLLDTCTNTTYSLFRDNSGQFLCAKQVPYLQSGDGSIGYMHYFDEDGKTFAFERHTSYINSFYEEGYYTEQITEFYNEDFNRIEREKVVSLEKGEHPWNQSYEVAPNLSYYLNNITQHNEVFFSPQDQIVNDYSKFVDSRFVNKKRNYHSLYIEHEITYLGQIQGVEEKISYSVVTDFSKIGIGDSISKKGQSKLIFISSSKERIYKYDMLMPDNLPYRIENNFLYFQGVNSTKIEIKNGLNSFVCIPNKECFELIH